MENSPPKIVVAGMGSELRQDDAFGVLLAQRLKEEASLPACVTVLEVGSAGLHLVQQLMDGYQVLLLLDIVQWGGPAGTLHLKEIEVADVTKLSREEQNRFLADMHYINPLKALMMAKALKVLPQQVFFLGCESEEHDEIGVGLSAAVEAALPLAYQKAKAWIMALLKE